MSGASGAARLGIFFMALTLLGWLVMARNGCICGGLVGVLLGDPLGDPLNSLV